MNYVINMVYFILANYDIVINYNERPRSYDLNCLFPSHWANSGIRLILQGRQECREMPNDSKTIVLYVGACMHSSFYGRPHQRNFLYRLAWLGLAFLETSGCSLLAHNIHSRALVNHNLALENRHRLGHTLLRK